MGSRDVLTKPPRLVLRLLQRGVVFIFTLLGRITQAASVFVFRVFLTLVTAYLIFYFFMNSTYLRDLLIWIVDGVLPGRVVASRCEWGPIPWQARCVNPRDRSGPNC